MATIWIKEFSGGLDARRLPETLPGGTLIRAIDCHINRGGEIEQRAEFVPIYTLPPGTRGLAAGTDGLRVFAGAGGVAGAPAGITVQTLNFPAGGQLLRVLHTTLYSGQIAAIGQFAGGDAVRAFLNGAPIVDVNAPPNLAGSVAPSVLLTATEKLHLGAGPTLFFSAIRDGMDFGAGAGAGEGFISVSTHARGMERITGLAIYSEYVAVFSRRAIVIFYVDPDPNLNRRVQPLLNTGALGPRSIVEFGDGDLFYLDRSGVRSLRARDSSNSAATTDIGSAIDPLIIEQMQSLTPDDLARAIGVIEPVDGRFWLAIKDRIYVFTFFTQSRISAWTEYRPGFDIEDMVVFDDRVWLRSGDVVYAYGGTGAVPQYSAAVQSEVWMPYLDADAPTRSKVFDGFDAAVRGKWEVRMGFDHNDLGASDKIATIDETTYNGMVIPVEGEATHVSLRFQCMGPESPTRPAVISSAAIHFDRDAEEDS